MAKALIMVLARVKPPTTSTSQCSFFAGVCGGVCGSGMVAVFSIVFFVFFVSSPVLRNNGWRVNLELDKLLGPATRFPTAGEFDLVVDDYSRSRRDHETIHPKQISHQRRSQLACQLNFL